MLQISNLHVRVDGQEILHGIDLHVGSGELHVVMGPNGSGKSTLAKVLAGHGDYEVTEGSVRFDGQDLLAMPPEGRAHAGVFLAFQYPVEIPGIANRQFLRAAVNAQRRQRGQEEVDAADFLGQLEACRARLGMKRELLTRPVNEGFSGGEKKRNEMLQMMLLEPRLAILDETDSGLDVDALEVVAGVIADLRRPADRAFLVITHYDRLLDRLEADRVHVLVAGERIASGDKGLSDRIQAEGFGFLRGKA